MECKLSLSLSDVARSMEDNVTDDVAPIIVVAAATAMSRIGMTITSQEVAMPLLTLLALAVVLAATQAAALCAACSFLVDV